MSDHPAPKETLVYSPANVMTLEQFRVIDKAGGGNGGIGFKCPDCRGDHFVMRASLRYGALLVRCAYCGGGQAAIGICETYTKPEGTTP